MEQTSQLVPVEIAFYISGCLLAYGVGVEPEGNTFMQFVRACLTPLIFVMSPLHAVSNAVSAVSNVFEQRLSGGELPPGGRPLVGREPPAEEQLDGAGMSWGDKHPLLSNAFIKQSLSWLVNEGMGVGGVCGTAILVNLLCVHIDTVIPRIIHGVTSFLSLRQVICICLIH
jgi:hypothetical protein